jgi:PTH2 family peptidyl-tRNA hydrolase
MHKVTHKQVIVVRNDLNMRKGKMIAQGSHASMLFLIQKIKSGAEFSPIEQEWLFGKHYSGDEWIYGGMAKIVVRIDSEQELLEIHAKALGAGLESHIVIDSGRTEFNGVPTKTCLAIGPGDAAAIDLITGHLKLL